MSQKYRCNRCNTDIEFTSLDLEMRLEASCNCRNSNGWRIAGSVMHDYSDVGSNKQNAFDKWSDIHANAFPDSSTKDAEPTDPLAEVEQQLEEELEKMKLEHIELCQKIEQLQVKVRDSYSLQAFLTSDARILLFEQHKAMTAYEAALNARIGLMTLLTLKSEKLMA